MRHPWRIAFEIFAPPLLVLLAFYTVALPQDGFGNPEEHLAIIGGVFMVAAIPCLIYAAAMEFALKRLWRPGDWRAVLLSIVLGALAGLAIGVFLNLVDNGRDGEPRAISVMIPIGMVVGLIMGFLLRFFPNKEPIQSSETTRGK